MHFGELNPKLKSELEGLLQLVKDEQTLRSELTNILSNIISRL